MKNPDIKKVLGASLGPIIGKAAQFDYAGTQACERLKRGRHSGCSLNLIRQTVSTTRILPIGLH